MRQKEITLQSIYNVTEMRVKEKIKAMGFTLEQVAQQMPNSKTKSIGISKQSMTLIVNGNPQIDTLRNIASIIGCKVADFFQDETSEGKNTALVCPRCGARLKVKIIPEDYGD